jgi:hypothetical protein
MKRAKKKKPHPNQLAGRPPIVYPKEEIHPPRLTKEAFRAEMKRRGWTAKALAQRWGYHDYSRVSRIAGNERRRQVFDDALMGLPHLDIT